MKNDLVYPDFTGKCVSFSLENEVSCSDLLDPVFEIQGGRIFVVGTIARESSASDWAAHCRAAIAWDRVTDYIIFDSEESFIEASRISEEGSE